MGTDIHAFLEYKDNSEWECYAEINIGRYYELFKLMGVRGGVPIIEIRGYPTNLSFEFENELRNWEGDDHSGSWLNKDEVLMLAGKADSFDFRILAKTMQAIIDEGYEARLVYFFDN